MVDRPAHSVLVRYPQGSGFRTTTVRQRSTPPGYTVKTLKVFKVTARQLTVSKILQFVYSYT